MIELIRIKYDSKNKKEEFAPLLLKEEHISCLYKDNNAVYIVTTQGNSYKVPYKLEFLTKKLGI